MREHDIDYFIYSCGGNDSPNINSTDEVTLHRLQEHLELVDYTVYEPPITLGRSGSSQKSGIISGKNQKDQ